MHDSCTVNYHHREEQITLFECIHPDGGYSIEIGQVWHMFKSRQIAIDTLRRALKIAEGVERV